jgi:hypothetical protein
VGLPISKKRTNVSSFSKVWSQSLQRISTEPTSFLLRHPIMDIGTQNRVIADLLEQVVELKAENAALASAVSGTARRR